MSSIKQAVLGLVGSRMLPTARVTMVEVLNPFYTLFDLSSDSFKGSRWEPASKIQVDVGDWAMRTYTPIEIDAGVGTVRLLGFLHDGSPATTWLRGLAEGTATHVAGPNPSLPGLSRSAIFFGDETSLPAAATTEVGGQDATPCVFEVDEVEAAQAAAERLGLGDLCLVTRRADQGHLAEVVSAIEQRLDRVRSAELIMTGNGKSIQAIRAAFRNGRQGDVRQQVKAYWSPGKIGLD